MPASSYRMPPVSSAGRSSTGTIRRLSSAATVISRCTFADAIDSGEITKTTQSARRVPSMIDARHASLPRMSSVSTQTSWCSASSRFTSRRTKSRPFWSSWRTPARSHHDRFRGRRPLHRPKRLDIRTGPDGGVPAGSPGRPHRSLSRQRP